MKVATYAESRIARSWSAEGSIRIDNFWRAPRFVGDFG